MTSRPLVTVIIPHFNDLQNLGNCLDALDRQTIGRDRIEVIIGDNGSTCGIDGVAQVVLGRARVITVLERGAGPARNGAAALAGCPVLAFVDSDCLPSPQWVERGLARVKPGVFVGGKVSVSVPDSAHLTGVEAFETLFAFRNDLYVRDKKFTGSGNLFVMREDFERVGPFRVGVSEDIEWSWRAQSCGLTLVYEDAAEVSHPARSDWPGLWRKWRRVQEEQFGLACERPRGRVAWFFKSLAMPLSIVAHTPKVLLDPRARGARGAALAILARSRMARMIHGLQLLAKGG